MTWLHVPKFVHRRWLFWVNGIIGFFVLAFLVGYTPTQHFTGSNRLSDVQDKYAYGRVLPCTPRKNVVFLKTHKCASSSVQNILLRYANQRNLTVVLPLTSKTHYLSRLKPFTRSMIAGAPWEILGYNILCHHMVYNPMAVVDLMPKDSVYVTIVRDPVKLFESLYEYDQLKDFYKMDIEEYARATKNRSSSNRVYLRANGMGRNQMLYDLGVRPHQLTNMNFVRLAINNVDQHFDFVMVAEYFDESIILLRHILCWDLDEVVSLTINARMGNFKKNLTKEAQDLLREWHQGDQLLYEHFLKKFQDTVTEFGKERLATEVEQLRERRKAWFDSCVEKTVESKNLTSYKIWSEKVAGFKLKASAIGNSTCEDLVKPENFFTNEIRQRQILRTLAKGGYSGRLSVRGREIEKSKKRVLVKSRPERKVIPKRA